MSIESEKLMNLADGKLLYDDLRDRVENQVAIGEDEPQSETTKLWVDTDETGEDYEVPTLQEFNTAIAGKISEPANEGTDGQVLTTDGHGGRSWRTVQGGGGSNIDDTAGEGDTDVTWSADKLTSEFDLKAPKANPEFTDSVSLGRKANTTVGQNSVALGLNATASGAASYAEGINTIASQRGAHAEGVATFANGDSSHAEGNATVANGACSHSEGGGAVASGYAAHAEGMATNSSGDCSHAEGVGTTANGFASHVVGTNNVPDDYTSWVEWVANTSYAVGDKVKRTVTENNETTITGYICKTANSDSSFTSSKWDIDTRLNYVEMVGIGKDTNHKANGRTLDWDGNETISGSFTFNGTLNNGRKVGTTVGYRSIANGTDVTASGYMAYAEGAGTIASGNNSHAEGVSTKATLNNAHAENAATVASGMDSHAEGTMSSAKGYSSHAQNMHTTAVGTASHSEGQNTLAASNFTHAEGVDTVAMGDGTHVEGKGTIANGDYSHVSGRYNIPEQVEAEEWIANTQYDVGDEVKRTVTTTDDIVREYWYVCKTANNDATFTASKWTKLTLQNYAEIIGNGTADNARSNARTLDWQGNEVLSGDLTIKKGSADEVSVSELAEDVGDLKSAINGKQDTTFDVHFTTGNLEDSAFTDPDSHMSCDKTIDEIKAAHESGKEIRAFYNDMPTVLKQTQNFPFTFSITAVCPGATYSEVITYSRNNSSSVTQIYYSLSSFITSKNVETEPTTGSTKLVTSGGIATALGDKLNSPSTAGTAGQVLGLDSNLDPVWTTPQSGGGTVTDVQVNGTSIVDQGVANMPVAGYGTLGVSSIDSYYGVTIYSNGKLRIQKSADATVKAGVMEYQPIVPYNQHIASFYGLAKAAGDATQASSSNAVGTYTEDAKSAISEMLNGAVSVSGTDPVLTALPGVHYICGEVYTLSLTVPASGCIDVTFISGSTPTVLTITPPTGMTMKWANGFDSTSLEANTTYEINIMDGCLGVAGSWT